MKVFQTKNRPGILSFTNYERIDEDELYKQAIEQLKKNPLFSLGKKISGPSEEIQECRINEYSFFLINDFNYGVEIHSNSQKAIQILSDYFGVA